jgi:uncharacterized protein YkwD
MTRSFACLPLLALVLAAPALLADDKKPTEQAKAEDGFRMTADEKALLEMTNAERAKEKLPPLKPNPLLFKVARLHSENMAKKGEMNHVLDGKNPQQRTEAGGYVWRRVAENIAKSENFARGDGLPLKEIVEGWMNSKIHRDNILRNNVEEIGLGIARTDKGEVYYTQLFAAPGTKR